MEYNIKINTTGITREYINNFLELNRINISEVIGVKIITPNTIIYEKAFQNFTNLKTIYYFDNIISLGDYAFENCPVEMTIGINNNIKNIGKFVFKNTKINGIVINSNNTYINEYAFSNNNFLNFIKIKNIYNNNIINNLFDTCINLSSIKSTDNILTIGNNAFQNCTSLSSLSFSNCTSIGKEAFKGCANLTSLNAPKCTFVDYNAFEDTPLWDANPSLAAT